MTAPAPAAGLTFTGGWAVAAGQVTDEGGSLRLVVSNDPEGGLTK